jgi:virginiamycin B lyase
MPPRSLVTGVSFLVFFAWLAGTGKLPAQTDSPALSGKVTAEQGALEGVLVSAKRNGSTITVTVVSEKDGRYSFPATRLEPGQYALSIRAAGYELDKLAPVEVAADKTATSDLSLHKTADLASQLSNAEWLASMPGTDAQKGQLLNCVGCHTLERPLRSNYSADDFMTNILPRMQGYVNQSIPAHPQLRRAERLMEERGDQRVQVYRDAAEFLASINLSARSQWNFDQDPAAPDRGCHPRHLYRIRSAPRDHLAA